MHRNKFVFIFLASVISSSFSANAIGRVQTSSLMPYETSPSQTRTEEEWRALKDDVVEYEEIETLVHEFNPEIYKLWKDYFSKQREGSFNVSFDDAEELAEEAYESTVTSTGNSFQDELSQQTADLSYQNMLANIDNVITTSDAQSAYLSIMRTEKDMAETVKELLISLDSAKLSEELSKETESHDRSLLEMEKRKLSSGMSTEIDVLTKEKTLKDDETGSFDAENTVKEDSQKILVNLGFEYDKAVTLPEVRIPDKEEIMSRDLSKDTEEALKSSYALQYYQRIYELKRSDAGVESARITMDNMEETIKSDMKTRYDSMLKSLYDLEAGELSLQNALDLYNAEERKYALGSVSLRDLEDQKYQYVSAQYQRDSLSLELARTYCQYMAGVNGLSGSIS